MSASPAPVAISPTTEAVARKLAKSVGLRNIAVHEYTSLDWNVVYAVAHTHIEDFAEFGREISAWVMPRTRY